MKKTFFILIISLISLICPAQADVAVQFDERVDLMSVVWRLSGAEEYNLCSIEAYTKIVDSTFAPYKGHPVVKLAKQYLEESGIGYDAVVSYGLHLKFSDKKTFILDDSFQEGGDSSFDRWSEKEKKDFLVELNDFYTKSDFHKWYLKTESTRNKAIKAFDGLSKQLDFTWFEKFFGPQQGSRFSIVLSILVGPHNYGCSAIMKDGSNVMMPVIGCCSEEENGDLYYNTQKVLPIVIHEFCHHFCNPLNAKYWNLMSEQAEEIFKIKQQELHENAYGSAKIMMDETFVRASVIRYMSSHFRNANLDKLISDEEELFLLTRNVHNALDQYEQQRDKYDCMDSYMPEFAKAVNQFNIKDFQKRQKELQKHAAKYKVNLKNGAKNVPAGEFTLNLQFNKPMVQSISIGPSQSGAEFPPFKRYSWSADSKTLSIVFHLEPGKTYGLHILDKYYRTLDGYKAKGIQEIVFSTAK